MNAADGKHHHLANNVRQDAGSVFEKTCIATECSKYLLSVMYTLLYENHVVQCALAVCTVPRTEHSLRLNNCASMMKKMPFTTKHIIDEQSLRRSLDIF
jgi:hypothetical protein